MSTSTENRRTASSSIVTCVEFAIVLAFAVLLFSIAVYRWLHTPGDGDLRMARSQIGAFKLALKKYASDVGGFPSAEQGLGALIRRPADLPPTVRWSGSYLRDGIVPQDPWGNAYRYQYPPRWITVDLPEVWSLGPDGQDNTDDDIPSRLRQSAAPP